MSDKDFTPEQMMALQAAGFVTLEDVEKDYTPEMRAEIDGMRHEFSLQAIREELGITQVDAAHQMEITQSALSKLEKRQDMQVRTIKRYFKALGGRLDLLVTFPGRAPVILDTDDSLAHHHG